MLRVVQPDDSAHELDDLCQEFPCSPHWDKPEVFSDVTEIEGVRFYLDGLAASAGTDKVATGSAASVRGHELRRAYFELVERTCLLDAIDSPHAEFELLDAAGNALGSCSRSVAFPVSPAGSSWAYARSNGVAAGADWAAACAAAQAEACERHYVLSAWYGYSVPQRHPLQRGIERELSSVYDFEAFLFPAPERSAPATGGSSMPRNDAIEPALHVIGCFGFPKMREAPFLAGFGAAPDVHAAEQRAMRETLQRLGFLWGEAIPELEPAFGRTADYHQELYLWPPMQARVRAWLAGAHAGRLGSFPAAARASSDRRPGFVDITPDHLSTRLRVAKMVTGVGLTLTFGLGHPHIEGAAVLGAHPVA